MNCITKSIEYMVLPASLHDVDGNIVHINESFCKLFKTNKDRMVSKKLSVDLIGVNIISDFNVFQFLNDNLNNIENFIIKIKDNNEFKLLKINTIPIKNGKPYFILIYDDITNNMRQTYLYEELFNNVKKGVMVLRTVNGNNFFVKDINPFIEDNESINKLDYINRNVIEIPFLKKDISDLVKDVWVTGKKIELYNVECVKKNQNCWKNIYIYKISTGDIILIYEDTTDIINTKKRFEDFDKQKSNFLSNMSHEIRNPINTIVGFSNLLTENMDYKKQNEFIDIIKKSAQMLTKLVDDILDITKIEAGKLDITKTTFDVNKVLNELITINKPKLENNIKLKSNKMFSNFKIYTDEIRFRQIFNNLISNSIKFTKSGYIEFGYKKQNNNIVFYVKDTGIGIKKEDFNKIFRRFEQLDTNKKIGHGLGLSISNELLKIMGGEMWFESEYGKGTTFFFTIPFKNEPKPKKQSVEVNINNLDLENKTILIVEDIEFNTKLLISYLEITNVNIIVAVDGNDALIKYNENKNDIDLILMDIQIPHMSGNEVTRIIRTIDTEIPIIAQTAYALNKEIPGILKNGFNDLIKKPIVQEDLFKIISKYI